LAAFAERKLIELRHRIWISAESDRLPHDGGRRRVLLDDGADECNTPFRPAAGAAGFPAILARCSRNDAGKIPGGARSWAEVGKHRRAPLRREMPPRDPGSERAAWRLRR
jgi:hypothetical protein